MCRRGTCRATCGTGGLKTIELGCSLEHKPGRPSARIAAVVSQFGLPMSTERTTIVGSASVPVGPGRIIVLWGPSGSGKSTALGEIQRQFAGGCLVDRVMFPAHPAVIDRVAPGAPLFEAVGFLTSCGLGEARLWVRPFSTLSDGEQFRARLARAVARHAHTHAVAPLLCDEFCSVLHRRAAKAISFGIRKVVSKRRLCFVAACSNDDLLVDLQPDTIVRLHGAGRCSVEDRTVRVNRPFSLRRRLCIEPGGKRDYDAFAAMHYRATDELGFVDKVFVMRDGRGGDAMGIVVYAHAPLELALRNRATDRWFSRNPKRVNRSLRILRRLVIHPDVRGCGLGHHLVRKTLPLVGTEFVECLAGMGEFNPVFERAGMKRIGQYGLCPKRQAALVALRKQGIDPSSRAFVVHVCRRRSVREIVADVVHDWYASTTGGGDKRVARQSAQVLAQTFRGLVGSRPVYYLWRRRGPV